jgi:hypothetical protein
MRAGAVSLVAAGIVWTGAAASSGAGPCTVEVDAAAGEAGLVTALADAEAAVVGGCADWTVTLTGTFELTDTLVWDVPVPLTLRGPADGTATLQAVGDPVTHRILTVDTFPDEVLVTLERLVLTGGDVSQRAIAGEDEGGAVLADLVRLVDSELTGNAAVVGGAVSAVEVTAIRTSLVGNQAVFGDGLGGAINAYVAVDLENVTLSGNAAKVGGAVHMDLIDGTTGAAFDATFVTFLDNVASDAPGGADLHLEAEDGVDLPVTLRGVLFGGVGSGSQPSCAGNRIAGATWTASLATDESCGAPEGSVITRPADGTATFRTGTADLFVPTGDWAGLDAVACDATWPDVDQRGSDRPQPNGGSCDVGAVEREVVEAPEEDPVDDDPPAEDTDGEDSDGTPPDAPVTGPVPSSVPAGGGGCADGCP